MKPKPCLKGTFLILGISMLGTCMLPIALLLMLPLYMWGYIWIMPGPPEPEITSAEIHFRLEYEVLGEKKVYEDALICEYTGYDVNEGQGKVRTWNDYYKSTGDDANVYLHQISETKYITLGVGTTEYFMGVPEVDYVPDNPYISIFDTSTGYYLGGTEEELSLLEESGFKIIKWYCDPPVDNTFK